MVNCKKPAHPVQERGLWPPDNSNEYFVVGTDNWWKVAKLFKIDVWDLIEFNFKTRVPEEVNWYLRVLVGCKHSTDGRNYAFLGADISEGKGKIYIPQAPPLPVTHKKTWVEKLAELKMQVEASNDPRKSRFLCIIDAMEHRRDDRVITWGSIAPLPYTGAPLGVKTRGTGAVMSVDPQWLKDNIRTWEDVAKQPLGNGNGLQPQLFVLSLHKFLFDVADGKLFSLGGIHDSIIETHDMFEKWRNAGMGGSSGMPQEYRAIMKFVQLGEGSPGSVLNCVVSSGNVP
jgi:hypothetical protein